MNTDRGFAIETTNCYHNVKKLCIGIIIECNAQSEYGIIYESEDSSECKNGGLYYFYKDQSLEIPPKTFVSFIKDLTCSWKNVFEVTDVCILQEYVNYILTSKEERQSYYESSSTKRMEELMSDGKNFIVIYYDDENQDLTSRLYYPHIDNNKRKINYYFFTSASYKSLKTIFECYTFLLAQEFFASFSFITNKLHFILDYVEHIEESTVSELFCVYDEGCFQSRPGRDDHYIFSQNRVCSNEDRYLSQITTLGSKVISYYNCQGRDDNDYYSINIEETEILRNEVKLKYNKRDHLMFLISHFLDNYHRTKAKADSASLVIANFISKGEKFISNYSFESLKQWIDFISTHNKFY
mgnify:FL=1